MLLPKNHCVCVRAYDSIVYSSGDLVAYMYIYIYMCHCFLPFHPPCLKLSYADGNWCVTSLIIIIISCVSQNARGRACARQLWCRC